MNRESVGNGKPDLPELYGIVGLFVGFLLSLVYFDTVMTHVPNEYFPLHIVVMVLVVPLFLGVPVIFEKVYWWWSKQ